MKEWPSPQRPWKSEQRERNVRLKEEQGLTRRKFLLGATAGMGTGAFFGNKIAAELARFAYSEPDAPAAHAAGEVGEKLDKQRAVDAAVAEVQRRLALPEVRAARAGLGENPNVTLMRALEMPFLREQLQDTQYDPSGLLQLYPTPVEVNIGDGYVRRGNGVRWKHANTVLTAAHVIHGASEKETKYPAGIDVDFITGRAYAGAEDAAVVYDDPALTDEDIHGQFGVVVGKDRDGDGSGERDNISKVFSGVVAKITPELARRLSGDPTTVRLYEESFMLVLPPGEARPHDVEALTPYDREKEADRTSRASGMSGSPFFVYRNGTYQFAGTLWGVSVVIDQEGRRTVCVGFIHGVDAVRRVEAARGISS